MTKRQKIEELQPHAQLIRENVMADVKEMEAELAKTNKVRTYCIIKKK